MSPEQALGRTVDPRTDLFSLGAVLYEMVTGERAFGGAHARRRLRPHPEPRAAPRSQRRPARARELEVVLDGLLAKQPEQRHASAAELHGRPRPGGAPPRGAGTAQRPTRSAAGRARPLARRDTRRSLGPTGAGGARRFSGARGGALWQRPRPLSDKRPVLLAGFENKTGEAVFDQTLPYALAVQLGQSPFLNIVTDDRVRETLLLMGRDATSG